MPIHAPKILVLGVWTLNVVIIETPKRHILGRNRTYMVTALQRLYTSGILIWSRDVVDNQSHREENWCLWPMVSSAHPEHHLAGACNVTNFEVRRRTGQPVLSDTVRTRRLKLFGHVARADKSQDHSRALQACISPAPRNWRRRAGHPRHTCLRTVEEDLRQFNLGLASGLRRAQNRTTWRTLTGTATSPTSSGWLCARRKNKKRKQKRQGKKLLLAPFSHWLGQWLI